MRTLTLALLGSLMLVPAAARALPEFPDEIADDVGGSAVPACSLCHLGGKTGGITTVTPFVLALKQRGFEGDEYGLRSALRQLETDAVDTDGDGVGDVAELRAGTDPASPVPGAATGEPSYGCRVAGGAPALGALPLAGLALAWLARRRRPNRARSSR
ncbi:MAG TPA: thrombospondin type 3 repeat-containing protein [Polyangia bacterium]|nr:thrombospondin type 3 repeat-containing protein [Polyangia bacterium]